MEANSIDIGAIINGIGIVSILGAVLYAGKKLQILDELKSSIEKTKSNLKVICDYLTKNHSKFDPSEIKGFSPLGLTKKGYGLIEGLSFDKVFEKNKKDFFDVIDDRKPKLKYEVETAALHSIIALSNEEYMDFLKVFFYNNPKRNMDNTAPTLGLYIRDKYLENHPEIKE